MSFERDLLTEIELKQKKKQSFRRGSCQRISAVPFLLSGKRILEENLYVLSSSLQVSILL